MNIIYHDLGKKSIVFVKSTKFPTKKRDSQGEELSFGQQGYFKNSKIRYVRYNLSLTDSILEYMSSHGYDVDSAVDKAAVMNLKPIIAQIGDGAVFVQF